MRVELVGGHLHDLGDGAAAATVEGEERRFAPATRIALGRGGEIAERIAAAHHPFAVAGGAVRREEALVGIVEPDCLQELWHDVSFAGSRVPL